MLTDNSRAAIETSDSEALRNRIRQEAQQRELQQKLPSVTLPGIDLQGELPQAESFQLPDSETPCFIIQNFVLSIPDHLATKTLRSGESRLPLDTFGFAQDFLDQYAGRCIGREGIALLVNGVTAKIVQRGYSTTQVSVPPQDLSSGTLKLALIPGIIRELSSATSLPAAEIPCFTIQHFVLEVPERLSAQAHRYGTSSKWWSPFRFAQNFLEQYAGRCIGHEGINLIVKGLTAKILEHGYSTTRVGIPEQDLSSSTLKLTLVPGMIHEIRFADPQTTATWKNAFPTSSAKLLNLRDLEQGLEQMKRVTSQEVDMQIVPAQNSGAENLGKSDILITVKRTKPWKLIATLDDSGAKGTGKNQAGLQLGWDNLLNANDLFNLGINTDAGRDNNLRGTQGSNFSYSLPFDYWTTTLSASESRYHQRITGAVQSFVSSGTAQNLEAKISYLFYRDRLSKNSLQFRTGKRWSRSYIDDTEVAVQKRNITLAEIALIHKRNIGQSQLDVTFAYRWGAPWFGAQTDAANLPTTSPRYRYRLETLDASLTVPFNIKDHPLNYSATLRAQNTHTALYASEWFVIGNRWTVRGFDGESSLGDEKGFFMRNEISTPIADTLQSVYVGIDFGKVFGQNAANLLGNKLAGMAWGLKGTLVNYLSYDVFVGRALYQPQNFRTDQPAAGFTLVYQR